VLWQAQGTIDHFLLLVMRTEPSRSGPEGPLRLPMVADAQRVVVRLLDLSGSRASGEAIGPATEQCFHGRWLTTHGLPLPNLSGEAAVLFEIVTVV